jgi:hypothetical protein
VRNVTLQNLRVNRLCLRGCLEAPEWGTQTPSMGTRPQNERKFRQWIELPSGGRRYWPDVAGRHGWLARYLKEVDANEATLRFWQEIHDDHGKLVEIHEKYPVDQGHRKA